MADMLNEYFVNIAQELKQSQTSSVSFDSSKLEELFSRPSIILSLSSIFLS